MISGSPSTGALFALSGAGAQGVAGLTSGLHAAADATGENAGLRRMSEAFEKMFIAEMLKSAKIGEENGPFSGGHGAEHFRSFMISEYADAIQQQGGFNLADQLYRELQQKVSVHA